MLSVPHLLHAIQVTNVEVLDLRSKTARDAVGLEDEDITGDWAACQAVGHAAWFLEMSGVLAPQRLAPD